MSGEIPRLQAPDPEDGFISPAFRDDVISALNAYPWFAVLQGRRPEGDARFTQALATSLTTKSEERARMTVTPVRYNPKVNPDAGRATSFSATAHALDAHTDSTFMPRPHEFVAFQFAKADPTGGDTIMLPVEKVLERVPEDLREKAAATEFFWGHSMHPIVTDARGRQSIRFYRTQLDKSAGGALKREDRIRIADAFSEAVRSEHEDYRFHAEPGEIVLINNTKTLHSRTAFAETSERLMFRVRSHSSLIY